MRITKPPVVQKSGIVLRQIEPADIDAWYGYLSIPHVLEHTSWALDSIAGLKPSIDACLSPDPSSPIRFAVLAQANGPLIGTVGFHTISVPHRTAEIAYDFSPDYWGKGIATACCNALAEWGFSERKFARIQATALDTNKASIHVIEKCGFSLEGKLRNFRMVRGLPRDFWLYAKTTNSPVGTIASE